MFRTNFLRERAILKGDIVPYVRAEYEQTNFPSRRWVAYVMEIVKKERLASPVAARAYAYVASLYSDVLEATNDTAQASLATANLVDTFFPSHKADTSAVLGFVVPQKSNLIPQSRQILNSYLERNKTDNFTLVWDEKILPGGWYIQDKEVDRAAMAKEWKTWVVKKDSILIPKPPKRNSPRDRFELKKLIYATQERTADDEEFIFFWEGIDNFTRQGKESITLGGVWQNIFYVTVGEKRLDNKTYAHYQKTLAQGIADAFILTWKEKYTYFTPRPSMRIPRLALLIADPPYPSYVSEYAAVSHTATLILSTLFPEKKDLWLMHATNAENSRLSAGVDFNLDIEQGGNLGDGVGKAVMQNLFPDKKITAGEMKKQTSFLSVVGALLSLTFYEDMDAINRYVKELFFKKLLDHERPAFVDVSEESGVDTVGGDPGVALSDYNTDGYLDLLLPNGLYRNTGHGTFIRGNDERLRAPGVFGDFDNDGCPDLYTTRNGPPPPGKSAGSLFHNNCDGTFTDVTKKAGAENFYHTMSASWADYDNDGYLDLYIVNRGLLGGDQLILQATFDTPYIFEPNILYHNNHDGTFTDVTKKAGVVGILECSDPLKHELGKVLKRKLGFQAVWFDYNNDRKPDLFVVTDALVSPLYKNNGDGTFTQVTETAGLCAPGSWSNMGATVGDYDNDGFLDLYVTNASDNFLWHNNGDGTFTDTASKLGVNEKGYGWGTEFLDYNNDGYMDIIVINGNNRIRAKPYYVSGLKGNDLDELYKNNGNGTFRAVGKKEGVSELNEIKYSVAVGDYNNDGAPDIIIPASPTRHQTSHLLLYKNQLNTNHWLTIQLVGVKSNRDGIGARLTAVVGDKKQIREIIAGSSHVAESSLWQTFGLGTSKKMDTLEILWPSGTVQTFKNITADRKIIIKEGDSQIHEGF